MRRMIAAALILLGMLFVVSSADAQNWTPSVLKVHGADPNDLARVRDYNGVKRLRKTDEEFTNEQAVVKLFSDGKRGLFVEMRTGALADGIKPPNHMQAACTPVEMVQNADGSVAAQVRPGEKFVTDNKGNEYRNANKPELMPVNGGKNMLLMFNYQPAGSGDTKRYVKVLDQDCNPVPIVDKNGKSQKQIVVMAKNNDDCDMHQTGEGGCDVAADANGTTHLTCWAGCNGNGQDDGWLNDLTISCDNGADGKASKCKVAKNFDVSLCQREERSRGRCSVASDDPNTAICTWTEGNNQPQRDGTWIAAVDISAEGEQGEEAQSRILWKKQIEGRKEITIGEKRYRTYSVRAKHTRLLVEQADGTLRKSDTIIFHAGDLIGSNNDDKKGGRYVDHRLGVARATKSSLEWLIPVRSAKDIMLGIDGTHLSMTGAVVQDRGTIKPAITFLQGSQNGGGLNSPDLKIFTVDLADKKFVDFGTYGAGGSYDRHLYSNYLGNNPGNQGRNFAGSTLVKNPFVGQNGNGAKFLLLHALTGKDPADVMKPELKPSSYMTIMPMASSTGPATTSTVAKNGTGGGQYADQPLEELRDPPPLHAGGCSLASTPSSAPWLLGLVTVAGIVLLRRRGCRHA